VSYDVGCVGMLDRDEMIILGKSIYHHHYDRITTGFGQPLYEIHRNVLPTVLRNRKRL
jgi:hypothetical protein